MAERDDVINSLISSSITCSLLRFLTSPGGKERERERERTQQAERESDLVHISFLLLWVMEK